VVSKEETNTIDREAARRLEGLYLDRFRTDMAAIRELYHPLEKKYYPAQSGLRVLERDGTDVVRRLMERTGRSDRGLLSEMPADRGLRFEVAQSSFFGKTRIKVVVAAQVLSPLQELLRDDATDVRVGAGVVREAVESIVREPEAFYYVGIAATTGFASEAIQSPPSASNALVALAEPAGATAWRLHLDDAERWKGLACVFDPEQGDEKVVRCMGAITELEDLQLRGGHILMEDLYRACDFPATVVDEAVTLLTRDVADGGDGEYLARDVGERRILQRARFPAREA